MTLQSHYWAYTLRTPKLKDTCTPMFIAALFTIASSWKQPRCSPIDEWIKKLWYIYIMEYSVQFSCSVMSDSLRTHGLQHTRVPCPSHLPELAQTHVHYVSDAIQPSHPLLSPSPPTFNLSQHQSLFQ